MTRLLLALLLLVPVTAGAQDFAIADLVNPVAVLDADVVVRLDDTEFEVSSPERATLRRHFVVTIFKKSGKEAGFHALGYDRFRKIKKFDGRVRDASGKVVKRLGKDDVLDVPASDGITLYSDSRMRVAALEHGALPYTVEYETEVEIKGILGFPDWYPQRNGVPVEKSTFRISAPKNVGVRHRMQHLNVEPAYADDGQRETWTWSLADLPGFKPEPYGPTWEEQQPAVLTAPTRFKLDDYEGAMATWQDLGGFMAGLYKGRQTLPDEARRDIHALTDGLTDNREKAKAVYDYVQKRTRYVSVQLGVGGWQPFDAQYVHARGYGDCKALTNYTGALLKEVGVESYPAAIRGGGREAPVLDDFPSNQFNHVILYVPLADGPLWLETTSQTNAFGHLGAFTGDRYALVMRPDSSFLARTPAYAPEDNTEKRRARVTLISTGSAKAELEMAFTGEAHGQLVGGLLPMSARDRAAWLRQMIDVPSFEITASDFSSIDARADTVRLPVALELPRYASASGTRLFVPVNVFNRWQRIPEARDKDRAQPVQFFPYAFLDEDEITFEVPASYGVEALPAPVTLETPFATYDARVEAQPDGTLKYTRRFEARATPLEPTEYDALRTFLESVARADRAQAVLRRE